MAALALGSAIAAIVAGPVDGPFGVGVGRWDAEARSRGDGARRGRASRRSPPRARRAHLATAQPRARRTGTRTRRRRVYPRGRGVSRGRASRRLRGFRCVETRTTMTVGGDVDDGTTRGRGAGVRDGAPSSGARRARATRGRASSETGSREPLGTAPGRSDGHRASGTRASFRDGRARDKNVRSGRDAPCASSHAIVSATTRGTPPHPSLHASRRGAPNTGIVHGSSGVREGTVRARVSVPNRVRREKRFGGKTRRGFGVEVEEFFKVVRAKTRWLSGRAPLVPSEMASRCACVSARTVAARPRVQHWHRPRRLVPLPAPPPTTRRPSRSMCCTATRGFPGRTHLATARRLRGPAAREAARRAASAR